MLVSAFQRHISERVRLHARFVQSYWLGSEVELSRESEEKLSQVWLLMRGDETPVLQPNNSTSQGGFPPTDEGDVVTVTTGGLLYAIFGLPSIFDEGYGRGIPVVVSVEDYGIGGSVVGIV